MLPTPTQCAYTTLKSTTISIFMELEKDTVFEESSMRSVTASEADSVLAGTLGMDLAQVGLLDSK